MPHHGLATKTWTRQADGTWDKSSYTMGMIFSHQAYAFTGLSGLYEILETVSRNPRAMLVRARLKGGIDPSEVYRRKDGNYNDGTDHLVEIEHHWLLLDFDDIRIGPHDLVGDPEAAIKLLIEQYLPPAYHGVSFIWQLSASAGMGDGPERIRAHLFFMLDRPMGQDELTEYHRHQAPAIDQAVFGTVQPLYIAAPQFRGGFDPLPRRLGLVEYDVNPGAIIPHSSGQIV